MGILRPARGTALHNRSPRALARGGALSGHHPGQATGDSANRRCRCTASIGCLAHRFDPAGQQYRGPFQALSSAGARRVISQNRADR
jgi:hypothetical protein